MVQNDFAGVQEDLGGKQQVVYMVMATTTMHVVLGFMLFMDFTGVAMGNFSFLEIQTCHYHCAFLSLVLC